MFVRVYPEGADAFGEWVISLEEFKQFKSLAEIKDVLALPGMPKRFSIAEIPTGTIIRESKAAKIITNTGEIWGNGGARQYLILGFDKTNMVQQNWFKEVGNIIDVIK